VVGLAVGIALALTIPSLDAAGAAADGFRLADASGGCAYVTKRRLVACRSARARSGFGLAATGDPLTLPRALARWPLPRRVLRSGAVWRRGGVTCRRSGRSAMCTNRSGAAIAVTPDGVAALAAPASG
jgi:hypothetical protein